MSKAEKQKRHCCYGKDGHVKRRYDTVEQAEHAARSASGHRKVPFEHYECHVVPGTYHLARAR